MMIIYTRTWYNICSPWILDIYLFILFIIIACKPQKMSIVHLGCIINLFVLIVHNYQTLSC